MPRRLPAGYPAEAPPSAQNRHFRPPSADPAAGAARSTSADGHRRGGESNSGGWMPRPPRRRRYSEQFRPPPGPGRGGATEHRGVSGPACERRGPSPCRGSMFDRRGRREGRAARRAGGSGQAPPLWSVPDGCRLAPGPHVGPAQIAADRDRGRQGERGVHLGVSQAGHAALDPLRCHRVGRGVRVGQGPRVLLQELGGAGATTSARCSSRSTTSPPSAARCCTPPRAADRRRRLPRR